MSIDELDAEAQYWYNKYQKTEGLLQKLLDSHRAKCREIQELKKEIQALKKEIKELQVIVSSNTDIMFP